MSTATTTATAKPQPRKPARQKLSLPVVLLIVAGALALISVVRLITGVDDITSVGQVSGSLKLAIPIGLAGLGGLWAERAGVVNIGLEGMMILGTWLGAWAGYQWGPWVGVLFGILGGALGGLLHAVITVTFGVNHIVSGVAINILAVGATRYLSNFAFLKTSGSARKSPTIDPITEITVPGLSDAMKTLNGKHWFLISDLAGFLGGVVTELSLLTVVALLLVPVTWWVLWRTAFGLRLRSCGESPVAAESLGVNVYRYKYLAVIISGGFAGLGGVFLAEVASNFYQEGQTANKGYIGLAAMIFGNWMPGGLAMGAGLFGYTDSLNLRASVTDGTNVHALLLFLVFVLALVALWQLYRKKYVAGVIGAAVSALLLVWYSLTDRVPSQFVTAAPYIATLLVLALSAQRLRAPKAVGLPYHKGGG
ncbi:ABC transporter permease [Streptomyces sparsogenes]|uniref:ABC transporter permease n=1 Tax=Streptomyces sparsogenes TaxID=67365 RepID=UPI00331F4F28